MLTEDTQLAAIVSEAEAFGVASLPHSALTAYLVHRFLLLVRPAGLSGFFFSPAALLAADTVAALRTVGANPAAGVLKRAMASLPTSVLEATEAARRSYALEHPAATLKAWAELNESLESATEDLDLLLWAWVRATCQSPSSSPTGA